MQMCWHGAEGFRVLRITGKGDSGGKKITWVLFLAQLVLFDIMDLEKLLSALQIISSAA